MGRVKYLWDSNIAIYYLQDQFNSTAEEYIDRIVIENQPALSVITEMELLCWDSEDANDLQVLQSFLSDVLILGLNKSVKHEAVRIRKESKLKLPDAIIAATALTYELVLLTNDMSDFRKVRNLEIINPMKR